MASCKTYVTVIARFGPDGAMRPLQVVWEDGRSFSVDRVLDVRPAASMKAGGMGLRYTCRILGHETFLYYERDRWFVERRGA